MKSALLWWKAVSWRSLLIFFLIAAGWHALLLLTPKPQQPPLVRPVTQSIFIYMDSNVVESAELNVSWNDPTVYLLPGRIGFSSRVRNIEPRNEYKGESSQPLVFKTPFKPERWGGDGISMEALMLSGSGVEQEMDVPLDVQTREKPQEEGSAWLISGNLAPRLLPMAAPLPLVTATELLGPTILRVCVGANGIVLFSILEKGSGSDSADDAGILFSKGIRFQSDPDSKTAWGKLKIFWRAESPAVKKSL